MSLVRQVENLESAKSMWKALRNQFEGSGIVLYMQAAAKFSSMRCSDYTKLDDFILAYRQTMETLAQFKMKVRDPDAVIFFVEKVKDDYPMWAMNMRTRLRSLKEIEDIKISLLDEFIRDLKDESRENSNNKGAQMVMYQQPRSQEHPNLNQKNKDKAKPKIYNCKTCGNLKAKHPQDKCFDNPKNKEAKLAWDRKHNMAWKPYKSSSSSQNFNEARTSFFDESCVVLTDLNPVVMANNSRAARSEFWIYNTGASCYGQTSLKKVQGEGSQEKVQ